MTGDLGSRLLVEDLVRAEAEQERAERAYRDMVNEWLGRDSLPGQGQAETYALPAEADRLTERQRPHSL